jgi:hypothetical protein
MAQVPNLNKKPNLSRGKTYLARTLQWLKTELLHRGFRNFVL